MATIRIDDVPEELHGRLEARAAAEGRTVADLVIESLERLAARPSKAEVLARLATREPVVTADSSANMVRAARDAR